MDEKLTKSQQTKLVKLSKQGNSNAFAKLYENFALELYRFALYMTGDRLNAEDAVQEAVMKAWRGIGALKDEGLFKPWLFKILSNECKTVLKLNQKNGESLPIEDYDFLADTSAEDLDLCAALKDALSSLTPPDGQIIIMSVVGGLKSHEIADIYGMTPSTVRSRQKRALEKLKVILK